MYSGVLHHHHARRSLLRSTSLRHYSTQRLSSDSPTAEQLRALPGTVPYHDTYILLHTCLPPTSYPSKIPSRVQRALQLDATQYNGLVNFSWSPEQPVHKKFHNLRVVEWDAKEEEAYYVTAFSSLGGKLELPDVSMRNMDAVCQKLKAFSTKPPSGLEAKSLSDDSDRMVHLYVCTHGQRDCRCGDKGSAVFEALRWEVEKRQLSEKVKVGCVGHVGGHKYAANVLVYPYGDWLGYIGGSDIPQAVQAVVDRHNLSAETMNAPPPVSFPPLLYPHWRGRMGLDKEYQVELVKKLEEKLEHQ